MTWLGHGQLISAGNKCQNLVLSGFRRQYVTSCAADTGLQRPSHLPLFVSVLHSSYWCRFPRGLCPYFAPTASFYTLSGHQHVFAEIFFAGNLTVTPGTRMLADELLQAHLANNSSDIIFDSSFNIITFQSFFFYHREIQDHKAHIHQHFFL